jgi:hypothetical protein
MMPLDDKRWNDLRSAYGPATDVPVMLRDLAGFPEEIDSRSEPYFSLWSTLCHQGDVYEASYAALPHLVHAVEKTPGRANWSTLLLIAEIEICRLRGNGPQIPEDLADSYRQTLSNIPHVIYAISSRDWDELMCRVAMVLLAVAKGHSDLASAIEELAPNKIPSFMEWIQEN